MASIAVAENNEFLFVANGTNLVRISNDGNCVEFDLPTKAQVQPESSLRNENNDIGEPVDSQCDDPATPSLSSTQKPAVVSICVSQCGHKVAAVLSLGGLVCVWSVRQPHYQHCFQLRRCGRCLAFVDDNTLLVAGSWTHRTHNLTPRIYYKSGDVYRCDLSNTESSLQPQLVFGHLSMILDMCVSASRDCIFTCDRDEKVRCTSYPNTWTVRGYCLAHCEFVSCLRAAPRGDILATAGGDGKVCLWDPVSTRQLCSVPLPSVDCENSSPSGRKRAVMNVLFLQCQRQLFLVVVMHNCSYFLVYKLSLTPAVNKSSCHSVSATLYDTIHLEASIVAGCSFHSSASITGRHHHHHHHSSLLILLLSESIAPTGAHDKAGSHLAEFTVEEASGDAGVLKQLPRSPRVESLNRLGPFRSIDNAAVDSLYKQYYDNVSSYMRRKQARIGDSSVSSQSEEIPVSARRTSSPPSSSDILTETFCPAAKRRICAQQSSDD